MRVTRPRRSRRRTGHTPFDDEILDTLDYTLPSYVMIVLTGLAGIGMMFMVRRGHYPILIPAAASFWWIMLSYCAYFFGIIEDSVRVAMIRNGIAILCLTVIVGAICYLRLSNDARTTR